MLWNFYFGWLFLKVSQFINHMLFYWSWIQLWLWIQFWMDSIHQRSLLWDSVYVCSQEKYFPQKGTKRTRHLIHFSTILSKYKFFTDLLFFLFDGIEIFLANWWASRCSMRLLNRIKPDQKGLFWDVFLTKANSKL